MQKKLESGELIDTEKVPSGRSREKTDHSQNGRTISSRYLSKNKNDIALLPTIKAAAPYQKFRPKVNNNISITVKRSDFREKVREKRTGNVLLFLVDASGSMGAKKRMIAVKGAILSLLIDSYKRRDLVGLMTFRKDEAKLLLSPTKSTELAYKLLKEIPTGGKTPLPKGINEAIRVMRMEKHLAGNSRVIVILTDGRGNASDSGCYKAELSAAIHHATNEKIRFLVIDTEEGYPKLKLVKALACELNATYLRIDDLDNRRLANSIRSYVLNT